MIYIVIANLSTCYYGSWPVEVTPHCTIPIILLLNNTHRLAPSLAFCWHTLVSYLNYLIFHRLAPSTRRLSIPFVGILTSIRKFLSSIQISLAAKDIRFIISGTKGLVDTSFFTVISNDLQWFVIDVLNNLFDLVSIPC